MRTTAPNINRLSLRRLVIGSTVSYGIAHHRGGGHLPARPLAVTAANREKYRRILREHIPGSHNRRVISYVNVA